MQFTPRSIQIGIESGGFVRAGAQSAISAEVAGKIIEVSEKFHSGEFFEKGEVIVKIDPADYETAVTIAKAGVSMREKMLEEEERLSEEAIDDWKDRNGRTKTPPADVARETQLQVAKSNLDVARAELQNAETNLKRTVVVAPFNALLIETQAGPGQFVTPGMVTAVLASVDFAEIRLPLDYDEIKLLGLPSGPAKSQQKVEAEIHGANGMRKATIVRTENTVDENTRSVHIIARVEDPYSWFTDKKNKPPTISLGEYVSAEIKSQPVKGLVKLPREALRNERELVAATGGNTLSILKVEVVHETEDHVYAKGLFGDDVIILTSPHLAYEGEKVEVQTQNSSTGDQ